MVTPLVTPVNYSSIKPQYVPRNILLAVPVSPDAAILSVLSPSRCLDLTSHWNDIPLQMCLLLSSSSPDHLFCSVYGRSLRSSFHRLCYPCSLQMPSFCVYQRKITAVGTAFPMWEAGTDGIFWKATLSNLDFLDKEQGRAGHSRCPSGLSFFFFSFGSLLCLDAHPVTQPLQLASACPRCNTCLV